MKEVKEFKEKNFQFLSGEISESSRSNHQEWEEKLEKPELDSSLFTSFQVMSKISEKDLVQNNDPDRVSQLKRERERKANNPFMLINKQIQSDNLKDGINDNKFSQTTMAFLN